MISLILKWEKTSSSLTVANFHMIKLPSNISYLQQQQHHLPTTHNPIQGSVPHKRRRWSNAGVFGQPANGHGKQQNWLPIPNPGLKGWCRIPVANNEINYQPKNLVQTLFLSTWYHCASRQGHNFFPKIRRKPPVQSNTSQDSKEHEYSPWNQHSPWKLFMGLKKAIIMELWNILEHIGVIFEPYEKNVFNGHG